MGCKQNFKKISKNSSTTQRIVRVDKKGRYIKILNKKIYFDTRLVVMDTPVNLNKDYYLQDYRAHDGAQPGKKITLQITKRR
jgi:hypothetical protein